MCKGGCVKGGGGYESLSTLWNTYVVLGGGSQKLRYKLDHLVKGR